MRGTTLLPLPPRAALRYVGFDNRSSWRFKAYCSHVKQMLKSPRVLLAPGVSSFRGLRTREAGGQGQETMAPTIEQTIHLPGTAAPPPLICRNCGTQYPPSPLAICEECLAPVEPLYDPARPLP